MGQLNNIMRRSFLITSTLSLSLSLSSTYLIWVMIIITTTTTIILSSSSSSSTHHRVEALAFSSPSVGLSSTTPKNQLRQHRPLKMKQFDYNDLTAGGGSWYDVNKEESNERQSQLESSKRLGFQRDFVSNLGFFPYSPRPRRSTALN